MTDAPRKERHSQALEPELITDPQLKAEAEAANGLRQYDYAEKSVYQAIERSPFKLRPSLIYGLQREALRGISTYAGLQRPGDIEITNSKHDPVGAHLVPELLEELCEYVNDNWERMPIHLAAYVMWRLNWIHPFADGNGRTSRVLAFFILSVKLGAVLPGSPTLPELVIAHRGAYEDALDAADAAYKENETIDVSKMERLIESLLAKQLHRVYEMAAGTTSDNLEATPEAEKYHFQNKQWAVIDDGMISLEPYEYHIPKLDLASVLNGSREARWAFQLAEKNWIDIEAFLEAFAKALEIHQPNGRENIDWAATCAMARKRAAGSTRH